MASVCMGRARHVEDAVHLEQSAAGRDEQLAGRKEMHATRIQVRHGKAKPAVTGKAIKNGA